MMPGLSFSGSQQRVLVTGASGSIGREMVRHLKSQPDTDVITLNTEEGQRIDLQDQERLKALLRKQSPDFVYHLAALNPLKSNRGADYFNTNVQGTENLLAGVLDLQKQGRKMPNVFLASSALVYEPEKISLIDWQPKKPVEEADLDATLAQTDEKLQAFQPENGQVSDALLSALSLSRDEIYYNDSKLLAEMTARVYARKGVPVKTGRLVNCYGKQMSSLMNQLEEERKGGQTPSLAGKDSEARDYLFCDGASPKDDVLRMVRAITEKGQPGEAYHVSSSGRFVRSPQAILSNVTGSPATNTDISNAKAMLSNRKLLALGVREPKTTPEEGIRILRPNGLVSGIQGFWRRVKNWFLQMKNWFRELLGFSSPQKTSATKT